ncbi:MAG: hypothetical protein WCH99_15205 [Verrucomicrobiota bacterium]
MTPLDPQTPASKDNPPAGILPPPLPVPARTPSSLRPVVSVLLSLCLGLFLADAAISLADDSLNLLFGSHPLSLMRGLVGVLSLLLALVVYGLMGLTPLIPKRLFLPLTMFYLVSQLALVPSLIYFYNRLSLVVWLLSASQVILGLGILHRLRGGLKLRWPLVPEEQIGTKRFGWANLIAFLLLNVFLLMPVVVAYLGLCAVLAVGHFSDGFLAVRPNGLTVQVRKYVRSDGRTIQLVPMAHIGDSGFYQKLTQSFPTNAIILMEGVTDENNRLTNKVSYQRMATALGLSEQHEKFSPPPTQTVRADVDVGQFSANTIALLSRVMRLHKEGLTAKNLLTLMQYPVPPGLEYQLFDDLLTKRNAHLLEKIRDQLPLSETIIVPWGAAHMPGLAREIQKTGFRLVATEDYTVIQFGRVKVNGTRSKPE